MTSPAGMVVVPATLLPYGPTMSPAGMAPPAPAQIAGPASSADLVSAPATSEPVRIGGGGGGGQELPASCGGGGGVGGAPPPGPGELAGGGGPPPRGGSPPR